MVERSTFDPDGLASRLADGLAARVTDRDRPSDDRTQLGGASALLAAVALIALPDGNVAVAVLGALVLLAAWYLSTPAYAFALGHVALAAVLPEGAFAPEVGVLWIAVVEIGLVGMLLASTVGVGSSEAGSGAASRAVIGVGVVLGWVAVGVGLAWASARSSLGLPTAGGLLVVLTALGAYGLHRYQLVSLGLVDGELDTEEGGGPDE